MGNKPLLGIGLALLLLVVAVGLRYFAGGPMVKDLEYDVSDPSIDTVGDHHLHPQGTKVANKPSDHDGHQHSHGNFDDASTNQIQHIDMLTLEMKQSLRDQLIQHGSRETFTKADGTVVLPADGRATQVSVAVQMPDGSIQIREYSEIPDGDSAGPQPEPARPKIKFTDGSE